MMPNTKVIFDPEEIARMEIRSFVNEGLKAVHEDNLYEFDETFDELEKRYQDEDGGRNAEI